MKISVDDKRCMPVRAHSTDMGMDLRSNSEPIVICPGEQVTIDTGVRVAIPPGFGGLIIPRSGLGRKYRLSLANTVGAIDAEYRGNIFVPIHNKGDSNILINKYDRFCQLIIIPIWLGDLELVDDLENTERGQGGFGHTGVQ